MNVGDVVRVKRGPHEGVVGPIEEVHDLGGFRGLNIQAEGVVQVFDDDVKPA